MDLNVMVFHKFGLWCAPSLGPSCGPLIRTLVPSIRPLYLASLSAPPSASPPHVHPTPPRLCLPHPTSICPVFFCLFYVRHYYWNNEDITCFLFKQIPCTMYCNLSPTKYYAIISTMIYIGLNVNGVLLFFVYD